MKYFDQARWIWCAEAAEVNAYVVFTQQFSYVPGENRAMLRISADSQYEVVINGDRVGAGQYADYPEYKVFDEYDVTEFLTEGSNTLQVTGYCTVTDSSVYRLGVPGVLYEIKAGGDVLAYSHPGVPCAPHANYRSGKIENVSGQLGYTFAYDATALPLPQTPAIAVNGAETLHPRPVRRLNVLPRQQAKLQAMGVWQDAESGTPAQRMQRNPMAFRPLKEMTGLSEYPCFPSEEGVLFQSKDGDGVYVLLDLMSETAGWFDMDIEVSDACEILIGWGEHTDDLRLRTSMGGRNFGARYYAKPGRQRFVHVFKRCGLRYVQLFVRGGSFRLFYAGVMPTVYPLSDAPYFRTADRLHTRINEVCRQTLIHCLHEHYEDCPWREQALYAMDSRNQMLCGYYAFGEYDMPRESIRLLALSLRKDNLLELCAPARVSITIPAFSAMFIVELQEYMLFSGDAAFAREMLPTAQAIADGLLARRDATGLIPIWEDTPYWNFYEWRPYLSGSIGGDESSDAGRVDAPMNCFAAMAVSRLADLMRMLGEDGSCYEQAASELRTAAHSRFWNEEEGIYNSFANGDRRWHGAELTQALAVCSGVCPEALVDRVLPRLTDNSLVPVTLSYSIFQFDALMKRPEKWGRWVFDHVADNWGDMLCQNATTFWETLEGAWDFDNAGSLCHGWSAVPLYLYYAYAAGVKPEGPGFRVSAAHPVNSGLFEVSARIVKPDGSHMDF